MSATVQQLRLLLWELDESTSILTTPQVEMIIEMAGGLLSRSAAIGWAVKGGYYSDMIDIAESGSDRKLNQLYKNAERHWTKWNDQAVIEEKTINVANARVVGQGFKILTCKEEHTISLWQSDEMLISMNTRMYPLKRFPAIL